jgi:hypothetical protein
MEQIETRLAVLESLLLENHAFYMNVIHLILRSNEQQKAFVAEAIRKMLLTPIESHPIPLSVQQQLRQLRDDLLTSPDPEILAEAMKPPIRPV